MVLADHGALRRGGMDKDDAARRSIAFILPVVVLLIVYVSWLIFR